MGRIMLQNMSAISFNVELTDVGLGYRISVLMSLQFQPACFATELEHAGKCHVYLLYPSTLNTHLQFHSGPKDNLFPIVS
jgi:hypothetical protein